jgi:hypothetical protein
MGSCTRGLATVLLVVATTGCVTGHLFGAGRRWERARTFEAASLEGERLFVRYAVAITDDEGTPRGTGWRRAVVDLGSLRVESVVDRGPLAGRMVAVVPEHAPMGGPRPQLRVMHPRAGGPASLALYDRERTHAPFPVNAFTETTTAAWVYPLVPLALGVDVTSVPVLLFFAPAVMVIGD